MVDPIESSTIYWNSWIALAFNLNPSAFLAALSASFIVYWYFGTYRLFSVSLTVIIGFTSSSTSTPSSFINVFGFIILLTLDRTPSLIYLNYIIFLLLCLISRDKSPTIGKALGAFLSGLISSSNSPLDILSSPLSLMEILDYDFISRSLVSFFSLLSSVIFVFGIFNVFLISSLAFSYFLFLRGAILILPFLLVFLIFMFLLALPSFIFKFLLAVPSFIILLSVPFLIFIVLL